MLRTIMPKINFGPATHEQRQHELSILQNERDRLLEAQPHRINRILAKLGAYAYVGPLATNQWTIDYVKRQLTDTLPHNR